MNDLAVADSACLIGLQGIDRLDLLPRLFRRITAPPVVIAEFGPPPDWLEVVAVADVSVVRALETQLDEGEAAAIALALETEGAVILLDDKKARRVAQQLGLRIMGTIGLLLVAKKRHLIPVVRPVLDELQAAGFRISASLREEALRLAGEDAAS